MIAIRYAPEDAQNQSRTVFVYDGQGRRSKIIEFNASGVITETRVFLWEGLQTVQERDVLGAVTKRFYGQGLSLGASTTPADTDTLFYTKDHLGSTRQAIDATGTVRAAYEYSPYGVVEKLVGTVDLDVLYTGHLAHERSGLHLATYRSYDPEVGRWIKRDLIAEGDGPNIYLYVGGNPANYIDKFGLDRTTLDLGHTTIYVQAWTDDCKPCGWYRIDFGADYYNQPATLVGIGGGAAWLARSYAWRGGLLGLGLLWLPGKIYVNKVTDDRSMVPTGTLRSSSCHDDKILVETVRTLDTLPYHPLLFNCRDFTHMFEDVGKDRPPKLDGFTQPLF